MATKFVRTDKKNAKDPRGQAALVLAAMETAPAPQTIAEITADIKDSLITRQDPERVVAYYVTIFKKSGLVKAVAETAEPVAVTVTADTITDTPADETEPADLES
jgi:hypothetical protein